MMVSSDISTGWEEGPTGQEVNQIIITSYLDPWYVFFPKLSSRHLKKDTRLSSGVCMNLHTQEHRGTHTHHLQSHQR